MPADCAFQGFFIRSGHLVLLSSGSRLKAIVFDGKRASGLTSCHRRLRPAKGTGPPTPMVRLKWKNDFLVRDVLKGGPSPSGVGSGRALPPFPPLGEHAIFSTVSGVMGVSRCCTDRQGMGESGPKSYHDANGSFAPVSSTGHRNTFCRLSAGVSKSRVFLVGARWETSPSIVSPALVALEYARDSRTTRRLACWLCSNSPPSSGAGL